MEWNYDLLVYGTDELVGSSFQPYGRVGYVYRDSGQVAESRYESVATRTTGSRIWRLTPYKVCGYQIQDPGEISLSTPRQIRLRPRAQWILGELAHSRTYLQEGQFVAVWDGDWVCTYGFITVSGLNGRSSIPVFLYSAYGQESVCIQTGNSQLQYWNYYPRAYTVDEAKRISELHIRRLYEVASAVRHQFIGAYLQRDRQYTVEYNRSIDRLASEAMRTMPDLLHSQPGLDLAANRLSAKCLASYPTTDVDMIENLTQVDGWGDTLREYLSPIDLTPSGIVSAATGRYLSSKYGDALTVADSASLTKAWFDRLTGRTTQGIQTRRAAERFETQDGLTVRTSLVTYAQRHGDGLSRLFMFAADRGFLPGASSIWNVIPYSFVLDWFVNAQEILQAQDSKVLMNLLLCIACSYSIKAERTIRSGTATAVISYYDRQILTSFPFPYAEMHLETPSLNQLVTGAALLTQRVIH